MITDSLSSAGLNFLLPTNIQDRYQTGADLGSFGTVLKDRLGAISEDMDAIFEEAAAKFGISSRLIKAVAKTESNFNSGAVSHAGAMGVMQLMPGTSEENTDKAEERMQAFVDAADVVEKYGADGIITTFFGELSQSGALYTTFPEYKCNCSRSKIEDVIKPLGAAELYKIIDEEGCVKVHCHYCNTDHVFTKTDIDELFKI